MRKFLMILLAIGCLLPAISARAIDGTQLLVQIDRNLNPESYSSYRKLINVRAGWSQKGIYPFHRQEGN